MKKIFITLLALCALGTLVAQEYMMKVEGESDMYFAVSNLDSTTFSADTALAIHKKTMESDTVALSAIDSIRFYEMIDTTWSYDLPGNVENCSPAIANDGSIYIGAKTGEFFAINSDGSKVWSHLFSAADIKSDPMVGNDGMVYIASYNDSLNAFNADGSLAWQFNLGGNPKYPSPAISSDGNTIYMGKDKLHAINKVDGTQTWEYAVDNEIRSTPLLDNDGVIYVMDKSAVVYAVNADGTEKWKTPSFGDYGVAAPAMASDGTLYFLSKSNDGGGALMAVNPSDGSQKWLYETKAKSELGGPVVAEDGTIYMGSEVSDSALIALNPDGTVKWAFAAASKIKITPAIDTNGNIYAGDDAGYFYKISSEGILLKVVRLGIKIWSSPSIALDGNIYIAADQEGDVAKLFCIEGEASGAASSWSVRAGSAKHQGNMFSLVTKVWSYDLPGKVENCSPAIANDGSIYVGAKTGEFFAINSDGSKAWSHLFSAADIKSDPMVGSDGMIYMASYNDSLNAFNADGSLAWQFNLGGNPKYPSPAISSDGNTIYMGKDKLHAINKADGTQAWEYAVDGEVRSTPVVDASGVIYVMDKSSNIYAVNADGTEKWKASSFGDYGVAAPAMATDGTLYFLAKSNDGGGALLAVNPSDGSQKWLYETLGKSELGGPAIAADGTIYMGTENADSALIALNSDGSVKWAFAAISKIKITPAIDSDGNIYVGDDAGFFYKLNADGDLLKLVNLGVKIWSSPVIADNGNVVIAADQDGDVAKLYKLDAGSTAPASTQWPMRGGSSQHAGN